jgi:hypothetical protein
MEMTSFTVSITPERAGALAQRVVNSFNVAYVESDAASAGCVCPRPCLRI